MQAPNQRAPHQLGALKSIIESLLPAQCLGCDQLAGRTDWLCESCEITAECNLIACPRCAIPKTTPGLCANCLDSPNPNHEPFASITSPLIYRGLVRQLIKKWKFEGMRELTELLLRLACNQNATSFPNPLNTSHSTAVVTAAEEIDTVVPMPMHWLKQLRRGYNQAQLLATGLKQNHPHATLNAHALSSRWRTDSQHRLGRRLRIQNAASSFKGHDSVSGKHILLVDDVLTTGATSGAAAEALLTAGAKSVHLWCLARSP